MGVLTVNLLLSTLIFWIAARIYLLPKLWEVGPHSLPRVNATLISREAVGRNPF